MATQPAGLVVDCRAPFGNTQDGLELRVAGLFAILTTSAIGVSIPLLARGRYPGALFLARAFGAGVVLATGFAHVMVDSFNDLTSPCLGFSRTYPWSMVIAANAAILTFSLEMGITAFFRHRLGDKRRELCPMPSQRGQLQDLEAHVALEDEKKEQLEALDTLVISYVLEAGMIVHSFTIGIAFGANTNQNTILALLIALCFHQSLDGVALGATFAAANYSTRKYFWFALAFVLVTPAGVAVGLIIGEQSYHPNSPAVLGAQGVLNAISAGILIFNGLVDLMIPTFSEKSNKPPRGAPLTLAGLASLFLGCAAMCVVAKWA